MKRGGYIRKVNPARARQRRIAQFGSPERVAWIRSQPCVCGGWLCSGGWSDPSHVVSRGAGGTAADIVPMSRKCHDLWHKGQLSYCQAACTTLEAMRKLARTHYATIGDDPPLGETTT